MAGRIVRSLVCLTLASVATVAWGMPSEAAACGTNFTVVTSPNPGSGDDEFLGADAFSPTNAWAVGQSNPGSLSEHWDGTKWHVVDVPAKGFGSFLDGVSQDGPRDVWAGGAFNGNHGTLRTFVVHRTATSGWTVVPTPNASFGDNEIISVDAINPKDVWATGDAITKGVDKNLVMRWNGSKFKIIPVPNIGSGNNDIVASAAISDNDVWIAVEFTNTKTGTDQVATFHWNGSGWHRVTIPQPTTTETVGPRALVAISTDSVWMAGFFDLPSGDCQVLLEHWDGSHWVPSTGENPGVSDVLEGLAAFGNKDVYAFGFSDASQGQSDTLVEHFNGTAWKTLTTPDAVTPGFNQLFAGAVAFQNGSKAVWGVGQISDTPDQTLVIEACPA